MNRERRSDFQLWLRKPFLHNYERRAINFIKIKMTWFEGKLARLIFSFYQSKSLYFFFPCVVLIVKKIELIEIFFVLHWVLLCKSSSIWIKSCSFLLGVFLPKIYYMSKDRFVPEISEKESIFRWRITMFSVQIII